MQVSKLLIIALILCLAAPLFSQVYVDSTNYIMTYDTTSNIRIRWVNIPLQTLLGDLDSAGTFKADSINVNKMFVNILQVDSLTYVVELTDTTEYGVLLVDTLRSDNILFIDAISYFDSLARFKAGVAVDSIWGFNTDSIRFLDNVVIDNNSNYSLLSFLNTLNVDLPSSKTITGGSVFQAPSLHNLQLAVNVYQDSSGVWFRMSDTSSYVIGGSLDTVQLHGAMLVISGYYLKDSSLAAISRVPQFEFWLADTSGTPNFTRFAVLDAYQGRMVISSSDSGVARDYTGRIIPDATLDVEGTLNVDSASTFRGELTFLANTVVDSGMLIRSTVNQVFNPQASLEGASSDTLLAATNVTIDVNGLTSGDYHALNVFRIGSNLPEVCALGTYNNVLPIEQTLGIAGTIDTVFKWTNGVYHDITDGFKNITIDSTIFDNDNDSVMIGSSLEFFLVEFILDPASLQNVNPLFYYWNGSTWASFIPNDGTNGFRTNGNIALPSLVGWNKTQVNRSDSLYFIKIVRTRNNLITLPVVESSSILDDPTEYTWDETGKITIRAVSADSGYFDALQRTGGIDTTEINNTQLAAFVQNNQVVNTGMTSGDSLWVLGQMFDSVATHDEATEIIGLVDSLANKVSNFDSSEYIAGTKIFTANTVFLHDSTTAIIQDIYNVTSRVDSPRVGGSYAYVSFRDFTRLHNTPTATTYGFQGDTKGRSSSWTAPFTALRVENDSTGSIAAFLILDNIVANGGGDAWAIYSYATERSYFASSIQTDSAFIGDIDTTLLGDDIKQFIKNHDDDSTLTVLGNLEVVNLKVDSVFSNTEGDSVNIIGVVIVNDTNNQNTSSLNIINKFNIDLPSDKFLYGGGSVNVQGVGLFNIGVNVDYNGSSYTAMIDESYYVDGITLDTNFVEKVLFSMSAIARFDSSTGLFDRHPYVALFHNDTSSIVSSFKRFFHIDARTGRGVVSSSDSGVAEESTGFIVPDATWDVEGTLNVDSLATFNDDIQLKNQVSGYFRSVDLLGFADTTGLADNDSVNINLIGGTFSMGEPVLHFMASDSDGTESHYIDYYIRQYVDMTFLDIDSISYGLVIEDSAFVKAWLYEDSLGTLVLKDTVDWTDTTGTFNQSFTTLNDVRKGETLLIRYKVRIKTDGDAYIRQLRIYYE